GEVVRSGLIEQRVEDAGGGDEQLARLVVAYDGDLVLDDLAAVEAGDAADVDAVGARGLDLRHQGLVVLSVGIPAGVAGDLEAVGLGRLLEGVSDALTVGVLVVQDVDARDAE